MPLYWLCESAWTNTQLGGQGVPLSLRILVAAQEVGSCRLCRSQGLLRSTAFCSYNKFFFKKTGLCVKKEHVGLCLRCVLLGSLRNWCYAMYMSQEHHTNCDKLLESTHRVQFETEKAFAKECIHMTHQQVVCSF